MVAHAIEQPQRAEGVRVRSVLRVIERHFDMRLRPEIVNLVWLRGFDDAAQPGGIGQVGVMKNEPATRLMRIFIQMIDPCGVETRAPPHDTVNGVALRKQQLTQVGSVLPGDACD